MERREVLSAGIRAAVRAVADGIGAASRLRSLLMEQHTLPLDPPECFPAPKAAERAPSEPQIQED